MTKASNATRKTAKKPSRAAKPSSAATVPVAELATDAPSVLKPPRETKALSLRRSLQEPGGASMASIMQTTGWQSHTVRAALSGLRKLGWAVERRTEAGVTVYFINPDAPAPDGDGDFVDVVEPTKPVEVDSGMSSAVADRGSPE
jgi:Protein of unknown function (DUF3489)